MVIEYVKTKNGTHHITLVNYDNSFCYWISVLQRLHSSPTLNKRVIEYFSSNPDPNKIETILLKPVYSYAQLENTSLTKDDILKVYQEIINFMSEYIPQIVSDNAKHGYVPHYLLNDYSCPIIYSLFPNDFSTILNEIHIAILNFNSTSYSVEHAMKNESPFLASLT